MAIQNECTPQNIYGSFEQTNFLGCSVMSFSASAGLNEQVSELTVQLVRDTCDQNTKVYYDSTLTRQTTTAADPGFVGEELDEAIIGAPAYFRVADFEFSGIIQSWTKQNSESGNPVYTVKLVDPRQILEGAQLIIGDYAGGVGNTLNLFNVFGAMESLGMTSPLYYGDGEDFGADPVVYKPGDLNPDGATFGSPANYFGGANSNGNGMEWNQIFTAMNLLINPFGVIPAGLAQFGGPQLRFRGITNVSAGYGLMPNDADGLAYYFLDISELPSAPSYFRLNGTNITIMDVINTVTSEGGYDYYIELIPVVAPGMSPSGIAKFIKVRTINRSVQPTLGQIQSFLDDTDGSISTSLGRELRNEVTNAFVIGGPKETLYQAEQDDEPGFLNTDCMEEDTQDDDMIVPFFGLNSSGDAIRPRLDSEDNWEFDVETLGIQQQLRALSFADLSVTINEKELRFALGGYDAWLSYSTSADTKTDIATSAFPAELLAVYNLDHLITLIAQADASDNLMPSDIVNSTQQALLFPNWDDDVNNRKIEDLKKIYDWVYGYATEYYGKKFMVRVPFTSAKRDPESNQIITSEEPTDGGWTEQIKVLKLPINSDVLEFFKLDDYKIGSFVRFNDTTLKESKNLSPDEYGLYDSNSDGIYDAYVKASVEPYFVFYNAAELCGPRAVLSISEQVVAQDSQLNTPIRGLPELILLIMNAQNVETPGTWTPTEIEDAQTNLRNIMKDAGGKQIFFPVSTKAYIPDAACFGIKSNSLVYGPWYNPGPPGQVSVELDSGLVPWQYDGYTTLNLAGQQRADSSVTNMQVGEMGDITIPGYPTIPLGAEIGAVAGGYFGAGTNLVENRSASTENFVGGDDNPIFVQYGNFSYGGNWSGLYGPNMTSLSVNVSPEGITTSYSFRTFTPKFGKFNKDNAERLKRAGQDRNKLIKEGRLNNLKNKHKLSGLGRINNAAKQRVDRARGKHSENTSPASLLIGNLKDGFETDYKRTNISLQEVAEVANNMGTSVWENTAVMSLDGLLRPVSLGGDGSLPSFKDPTSYVYTDKLVGQSKQPHPPVFKDADIEGTLDDAQYNLIINSNYLNPLNNPATYDFSYQHVTTAVGHDIDMVGRGATTPTPTLSIQLAEGLEEAEPYADDYRFTALRGPLVIGGWGFDTNGKPVPNASEGDSALEDYFATDWLKKPQTWPVGPVDLRWDRERGVWVSPQSYKLVRAQLLEDLDVNSSAKAKVLDTSTTGPTALWDADGVVLNPSVEASRPEIKVYDNINMTANSGESVWTYWDTYNNKYYAIAAPLTFTNITGCDKTDDTSHLGNSIEVGMGLQASTVSGRVRLSLKSFIDSGEGSWPIITGVYCESGELVVQTGEIVWSCGQISGVRAYSGS